MRVWLPALALAATAFAAAPPAADADVRLSNERTVTRWAHANLLSKVRARPSRAARTIARLRWKTEDGPGRGLRGPRQPARARAHLDAGADPGAAERPPRLGPARRARRPAQGPHRPDHRPRHAAREAHPPRPPSSGPHASASARPARRPPPGASGSASGCAGFGGSYGPWAFGTSAYSDRLTGWPGGGVIGIHGTDQPGLIPGRPSHGCVRVPNVAIRRLARLMPVGTPVRIR